MRFVVFIILFVVCGCDTTQKNPPVQQQITQDAGVMDGTIEKLPKKINRPRVTKYKVEERLPSQFYISGNSDLRPGEKYTFQINTRVKDTIQTIIYFVKNPLVFINEIASARNPIISDAVLATLSEALIAKNRSDLISYQSDQSIQTLGQYDVVDIQETYMIDSSAKWSKRNIEIDSFAKAGMYLVEVRIGPQAAYLVVTANNFATVAQKYDNRTLVWITNEDGVPVNDVSLFYEDQQGNSLQKKTSNQGVAVVDSYSPWILAWQKSQIAVIQNPRRNNQGHQIWLDKQVYAPGEKIHIAWKHPLPTKASAKLASVAGYEILRREISPQPNIEIQIPPQTPPGKYQVQIENAEQKIEIVPHTADVEWKPYITTDRYVYKPQEVVTVNVYGVKNSEIQVDIYQQNDLVDRQIQINNNGMATCYLQLTTPGRYQIKSNGAVATIFIEQQTMNAKKAFPVQPMFATNTAQIFLPQKKHSMLYILQGSSNSYYVHPPQSKGIWKNFDVEGSGEWQTKVFSPGEWINTFSFHANDNIALMLPKEIHAQQELDINVKFTAKNYKYLLWATNGTQAYLPQNLTAELHNNDARNLPYLYDNWVRNKVKADYALAVVASSKKQYASTVYLCQQILKWIPQHKAAKKLLQSSIDIMAIGNEQQYLSPKERLKYTYIGGLSPQMTFQELIEKIEEQANVYIEVDPKVYEKYPEKTFTIAGLPSGENAFSLLSYFFTTRSLTYKIQHGVLFITLQSQNILLDLVDNLDKEIDQQIQNLPQQQSSKRESDKVPLFKTAFWTRWRQGKQSSKILFPNSGIWTLRGIIVDENNEHYTFTKHVWVADKLP